jgi:hypothetical protein
MYLSKDKKIILSFTNKWRTHNTIYGLEIQRFHGTTVILILGVGIAVSNFKN